MLGILGQVAVTLMWSLMLAALSVFAYVIVKWLQTYIRPTKTDERNRFEDLRIVIIMMPFVWLMLNFTTDTNTIAETMFGFWLPVVMISILIIGIVEINIPFMRAATNETRRRGMAAKKGIIRRGRR
jgi:undecaprenyl pyrophosphate phosphatase UppP